MRLKSKLWVQAYLRRCDQLNIAAVVRCSGNPDAGAIFIKVDCLDGTATLHVPAPTGFEDDPAERKWVNAFEDGAQRPAFEVEAYMARQRDYDDDLWWIEVERADGKWELDS